MRIFWRPSVLFVGLIKLLFWTTVLVMSFLSLKDRVDPCVQKFPQIYSPLVQHPPTSNTACKILVSYQVMELCNNDCTENLLTSLSRYLLVK